MMDLSGDMPVTLVIKAPNQRMADQTVDCMLGWTIKKLKQHLETVYPSKPKHNEQRLIYSGRLLQDHLTLKEILRQYDDAELSSKHTVHLVCSTVSDSSYSSPTSRNGSGNMSQSASSSSSTSQGNSSSSDNRSNTETMVNGQGEGLRYRGQGQPSDLPSTPVTTSTYTTFPMYQAAAMGGDMAAGYPGYPMSPEQYAWMMHQQQVYSQYMMQYMQYYQSHYNAGQSFNPQMPPSPFLQHPLGGASIPPPLQQQQQQAPQAGPQLPQAQPAAAANNNGGAGAARQNVRMNAQGGMEEDDDDEGEPRDWLHHTYFFMRFLTFMGILFFYSSLTRFLIVFTGSFAIYFLQKLRKYMQRAQREQEQQRQQEQNQAQQQNEQGDQQQQQEQQQQQQQQNENSSEEGAERRNSEETNSAADAERTENNQPQQEEAENEQGRLARSFIFICNTVQTFFTSLLPTPPELLEPN